jgi:hypothetical protein
MPTGFKARVQRLGKRHSLGSFSTRAEADAAEEMFARVFDTLVPPPPGTRWQSTRQRTADERFWELVEKDPEPDGCWVWSGALQNKGYGRFNVDEQHQLSAHLYLNPNPDPEHLEADHICHNRDLSCPGGPCRHRRCVRPSHVRFVSRSENVLARQTRLRRLISARRAALNRS